FLIQADWLPSLVTPLWDTSSVLSADSFAGRFLHALIGYEPSPSGMQMLFYAGTLALILLASAAIRRLQVSRQIPPIVVSQA
ncbi:MAG: iron permease, partial [Oxalobacteraceae bacterium]|nr:iron permease [Oxalobacteraceae bacterium]